MANHTWESLIGGLGLSPPLLAYRLLHGKPAPDWSRCPEEFSALQAPSNSNSASALLMRLSSSEDRAYFLTVVDEKVMVMHGLRELPELNAQGGCFAALGGDFRVVAGQTIRPSMYRIKGVTSRTALGKEFGTVSVAAQEWGAIKEFIRTDKDEDFELVESLTINAQFHLPVPT